MKKHDFGYFFREGLSNMFSHGFMTFAAIGITVACLLIMGTFTLVAVNANALLKDLEKQNEILAFVDDTLSDDDAMALQAQIKRIPNVTEVKFISRDEAMETFEEEYKDEEMPKDMLQPEIFRHRYAIRIGDLRETRATVEAVEAVPGVDKVNAYEEISNGFIAVRNIATVVCVALISSLFLVSMFIVSNTIKLTTFDRRDEIAIMRMVGATNGFIRWPFVYEGFLMGLLSALLSFGLQWLLYSAVATGVSEAATMQLVSVIPFSQIWTPVAVVFTGAGIIIGVCGSLTAIRRFLQV